MPFKAQGNTKERRRNAQQSTKQRKESTRKAQVASWPHCCFADASPLPLGPAVASRHRCCLGAVAVASLWPCCGLAVASLWPLWPHCGLAVASPWPRCSHACCFLCVLPSRDQVDDQIRCDGADLFGLRGHAAALRRSWFQFC